REPQSYLAHLALEATAPVSHKAPRSDTLADAANASFEAIYVVDSRGAAVARTQADPDLEDIGAASWFDRVLNAATVQPISSNANGVVWIISAPVIGADGNTEGAVVGDLNIFQLGALLRSPSAGQEVHIVTNDDYVVLSSDWGTVTSDESLAAKGALTTRAEVQVVDQALTTGSGSAQLTDYRNHQVIAGFAMVPNLELVVIASTDLSVALA